MSKTGNSNESVAAGSSNALRTFRLSAWPWVNDEEIGITFDATGNPIKTGGGGCEDEFRNNARIIAAAPEMLAALCDIRDFLRRSGYDTSLVAAVIRKATVA